MRAEAVSSAGKRNQGAVSAELLWKPQGRDEAGGEDQTWRAPKQEPRKHGEAGLGGGGLAMPGGSLSCREGQALGDLKRSRTRKQREAN